MAKRKKRLKKAQPGFNVGPGWPGKELPTFPNRKQPKEPHPGTGLIMNDDDWLKRIQNPKPYIHPAKPGVIRRDPNEDFPFIKPNNPNPDPYNYNPRRSNLQQGGMTGKDLDKIQAENTKKNIVFNAMKKAYDKRKKKRSVGTTQYPPFMFPPTTMKKGGSCGKMKDRVISGKSLR